MKSFNIPGLLIEYIISGALAFGWIAIFLIGSPILDIFLAEKGGLLIVLLIPLAYVIGMVIDMIVYTFVKPLKLRIRNKEKTELQKESMVT